MAGSKSGHIKGEQCNDMRYGQKVATKTGKNKLFSNSTRDMRTPLSQQYIMSYQSEKKFGRVQPRVIPSTSLYLRKIRKTWRGVLCNSNRKKKKEKKKFIPTVGKVSLILSMRC